MRIIKFVIILLVTFQALYSQSNIQQENPYEVFLIDAYVTPEIPYTFVLSFFTSDSLRSSVILDDNYEFEVSKFRNEDHKIEINISQMKFDSNYVPFIIKVVDEENEKYFSEVFELALPGTYNIKMDDAPGFITTCCFGGIIFGLPSPDLIIGKDENYFGLTKEIPIVTYYSHGYNYPDYYLSLEYSYIFNTDEKHIGRLGLKKLFLTGGIEYVSTGISYFHNFKSGHGFSPELSAGVVKISSVFTLYLKYRYNHDLRGSNNNFHELSIGLFSSFFSLNL